MPAPSFFDPDNLDLERLLSAQAQAQAQEGKGDDDGNDDENHEDGGGDCQSQTPPFRSTGARLTNPKAS